MKYLLVIFFLSLAWYPETQAEQTVPLPTKSKIGQKALPSCRMLQSNKLKREGQRPSHDDTGVLPPTTITPPVAAPAGAPCPQGQHWDSSMSMCMPDAGAVKAR